MKDKSHAISHSRIICSKDRLQEFKRNIIHNTELYTGKRFLDTMATFLDFIMYKLTYLLSVGLSHDTVPR